MINIEDGPEEGHFEKGDECFMLSVRLASYDEDELRVEGLINGDRWFAASWLDNKFLCNISRSPMCRDDFWKWAVKKKKTWFNTETSVAPSGDIDDDLPKMVSIMANLIHEKRRTLKIRLLKV